MGVDRFEIHLKEKGEYDNGVYLTDKVIGINHQMLDYGSAKDVCILLNDMDNEINSLRSQVGKLKEKLSELNIDYD